VFGGDLADELCALIITGVPWQSSAQT
jgi:hypothetical protein